MERLRRYLDTEGMSQVEFARRVGVSQPTVWEWINGKTSPSVDNLRAISRETKISIDELLAAPKKSVRSQLSA
jgi:transcriptional regulator with XRE-family HTH domain